MIVGVDGQNHNTKATSPSARVSSAPHGRAERKFLSSVYVQIDCTINGSEYVAIRIRVIKMFKCRENTTFVRKKYVTTVAINETVLAPDKSAMVRMDETVKMFSLRNSEYMPNAYSPVVKSLVKILEGTKR